MAIVIVPVGSIMNIDTWRLTPPSVPFSLPSSIFSIILLSLNQSTKETSPSRWHIGAFLCEQIRTLQPEDDWTYSLRTPKDSDIASLSFADASDAVEVVHEGETLLWSRRLEDRFSLEYRTGARGEYDSFRQKDRTIYFYADI